jgi:spermidine synthase
MAHDRPEAPTVPLNRVLPLVFCSGACALVYQIAWTRDFRLIFGASTPASAAVVAMFAAGLGLGAWRLGPRAQRSRGPLYFYAFLEAGIALSSAASFVLVPLAARAYIALGGTVTLGVAGATVARLLLAAMVLAVPTFLMGGTLPALARVTAVGRDGDPARRGFALLYGVNTLGAVFGCMFANFVLLEYVGTAGTLLLAGLFNLSVVASALMMGGPTGDAPDDTDDDADSPLREAAAPRTFVLAAAAVAGFAFFLMEMVFYRMLVPLLGGTVYTFGLVLAVALLGVGIGGALYSAVFARRPAQLSAFATTCLLEAAGLGLPYALGDRIAFLAIVARPFGVLGLAGYAAGWFVVAALVVLPASIAAGVQFPLLVALLGRGERAVARHVGLAYAWNTVGAIAGALAGGFGLMRVLGATGCWRTITELLVGAGIAAAALALRRDRRWLRLGAHLGLAVVAVGLVRATTGPTAAWRHSPIGAGRVAPSAIDSPETAEKWVRDARRSVAWEADGVESTIALKNNDGYSFLTNGKSDGHCIEDAGTQVMGGLVGAILHPAPASALVIGLGSGSTAGWLGQVPSMGRVDVVELEPAMLEVARRCAPVNEHALENPKVHVTRGDAREVLSVTNDHYDIIFSEPSNPYRAGVASLYTLEYYRRVLDHLRDDGLFLQWVQGYEVDVPTMNTIFATLGTAFPFVEVWQLESADLLFVGSRQPVVKDVGVLRARVAGEPFARALRQTWGVVDLEGFLAHFVAIPGFVDAIARKRTIPLNTDDRPVVEFGFARTVGDEAADHALVNVEKIARKAIQAGQDRPWLVGGEIDWDRFMLVRAEIPCVDGRKPYDTFDAGADIRERIAFESQWLDKDNAKDALEEWDRHPREPATPIEALHLAQAGMERHDRRAVQWVQQLASSHPLESLVFQAQQVSDDHQDAEAADLLERALVGYRSDPWASSTVMGHGVLLAMMLAMGDRTLAPRMLELLSQPFAIDMLQDRRLAFAVNIAREIDPKRGCAEVLAPLEPYTPWENRLLEYRRDCYRDTGDRRAALAEKELARFLGEKRERF